MSNTKVEDIERLHKLHVAGAITETEFKLLKKEIMEGAADVIDDDVYEAVKIGEQEWMVKNLNVEHFRNGDIIPEVKTCEDWDKAGEEGRPAWCYYDNDISHGEKYGKLYNWYAVNDLRGLAPEGWHVPTDAEFTVLTDYLVEEGHDGTEGRALKATKGWQSRPDETTGNGTNDYGWLGLPGGFRSINGYFSDVGGFGYWWSSSQYSAGFAWKCYLNYYDDIVSIKIGGKEVGLTVRCIKD